MSERIKILKVTPEFFVEMLKAAADPDRVITFRVEGLPEDARVHDFRVLGEPWQKYFNTLGIVIKSASFDEVKEGQMIPELDLTYYQLWACPNCGYVRNEGNKCEVCGRPR